MLDRLHRISFSAALRQAGEPLWAAQHAHPFVQGIGDGTLPEDRFRRYIRQDFVFLVDYGRLLSLAAARAPHPGWMRRLAEMAHEVLTTEMDLHRSLAGRWGVTEAGLEAEPPAPATAGYVNFLLRTASLGDFGELVAALLPCMWGYAEIGARLQAAGPPEHPGYAEWIATYSAPEFDALAAWCRELVDGAAAETGDAGRERMRRAFTVCSEHELRFWNAAWAGDGSTGVRAGAAPHPPTVGR